jgi:DnaK suppressor protein
MCFTAQEKDAIRSKIERKLKQFKEDIIYLEEATRPIPPENAIGRVSRMDAINNKSVNVASLTKLRKKEQDYREVLTRLDRDDFGVCTRCEEPLSLQRIMMMPESKVCMKCLKR